MAAIFPHCNLPAVILPHDDETYEAFKWLLLKILPRTVLWCIYDQDVPNCII